MQTSENEKAKIIYIGDPMCSWCYGIAEELEEVKKHFENTLDFELVLGGLRPYNQQSIFELKDFLTEHWQHVNQASQQPFNYQILESKNITYDTEPPCRATVCIRKLKPEVQFQFFKQTQTAFYYDNKNLHLAESYFDICDELKIDKAKFEKLFNSDEMKTLVKQDFERAGNLKARSFPTILLQKGNKTFKIAQGFQTAAQMIVQIEKHL